MTPKRFVRAVLPLQAAVLAACAAFVSGAGAAPTMPQAGAASVSFTDPSGDAQGGPDVTRVAVSGDSASGSIALTVTTAGYIPASPDALERDVLVWLDTDMDPATGDPEDGTEYALQAWNDASGRWWSIVRWTGADWESVPQSPSMSFTRQGDALTWTAAANDLGGTSRFRFYVVAGTWNAGANRFDSLDEAPDAGWWSFDLSAPTPPPSPPAIKVGLLVGEPTTTPPVAVAGKKLVVQFPVRFQKEEQVGVVDLATGETRTSMVITWVPASGGRISCAVSTAGRRLPVRCTTFKGSLAKLAFVIPKTAKGKRLRISVKIAARDAETGKTVSATRIATFGVK